MVVLTQDRKAGVIGLHIGAGNVQRFFPPDMRAVELRIDHLLILCTLDDSFWLDRPEIHDTRLSLWLESKRSSGKLTGRSAPVGLIPSGTHSFRLELASEERTKPRTGQVNFVIPALAAAEFPENEPESDPESEPESEPQNEFLASVLELSPQEPAVQPLSSHAAPSSDPLSDAATPAATKRRKPATTDSKRDPKRDSFRELGRLTVDELSNARPNAAAIH